MSFDRGVGWTGPRGWEAISLKSTGKLDPLKNFVSMSSSHLDISNFRVTPTCCPLIFPSFHGFFRVFRDLRLISFNPLDRYYYRIKPRTICKVNSINFAVIYIIYLFLLRYNWKVTVIIYESTMIIQFIDDKTIFLTSFRRFWEE